MGDMIALERELFKVHVREKVVFESAVSELIDRLAESARGYQQPPVYTGKNTFFKDKAIRYGAVEFQVGYVAIHKYTFGKSALCQGTPFYRAVNKCAIDELKIADSFICKLKRDKLSVFKVLF